MRVSVLGQLEVDGGAGTVSPRDRSVLAVLLLRHGSAVRTETIGDVLWGEDPPPSAAKVIQGCVARLRRRLGAGAIRTIEGGYLLRLHHDEVDVTVFEDLIGRARRLVSTGQPDRVRHLVEQALALWRGDPFVDIADWPETRSEIDRLHELRRDAEELAVESRIALGLHEEAVPRLTALVGAEPDREHRWALLALAQYRSGRQADALGTLQRARAHTVSSLGIEPGAELNTLLSAVLSHDPVLDEVTDSPPAVEGSCPYPGLAAFDAADAETFFGRDEDIVAGLRRLDERGVVALVGPSGCGKSSVLRAGIAAALLADGYSVEVLTPGPHPDDALRDRQVGRGRVLIVDQAEEVFVAPLEEAHGFLDALVEHVRRGGLLAMALRADRMGELAAFPDTARLVEVGLHLLGPLTDQGLREAIEGPAAQVGLRVEPGLVELLVQDVLGEPGALPLLSHVLRRAWEAREGRTLTVQGYRASGGVRAAVSQTAESVFVDLSPDEQEALRTLMTRLVGLDDHGDLVRQRVDTESIGADDTRRTVIARLADARLVSVDGDAVEISHESLAVAWPRLRSWLDEDVEGVRIMRHLSVAAQSWATLGRPASELYRGVRQARTAEWADRTHPTLLDVERQFLDASSRLAAFEEQSAQTQAEQERALNRRLRAGIALVGGLLVVALIAGGMAISASTDARQEAIVADARRLGAEALRSGDQDTALLLSAAAVTLHDDADTRSNLLAALDRTPSLLTTVRTARINEIDVDPRTGNVLVNSFEDALSVYDPESLEQIASTPALAGFGVVAGLTGGGAVAAILREQIGVGSPPLPPVVLLEPTGEASAVQPGGFPTGRHVQQRFSLSPNGQWLAAALLPIDGRGPELVGVWDLTSPTDPIALLELPGHYKPIVSDDGRRLLTLGGGELLVTDLTGAASGRVVTAADLGTRVLEERMALSPDGGTLAIAAVGEIVLVDTGTWEATAHFPEVRGVVDLEFSSDGARLAAGGPDLIVWDLSTEWPNEILRQEDGGGYLAFAPDGGTLYSGYLFDRLLLAWDLTEQRGFLRPGPPPAAPVPGSLPRFSPDGSRVLHVEPPAALRIRDTATGEVGAWIDADQELTMYLESAWSPDRALVTISTGAEQVWTWDADSGEVVAGHRLPPGERAVISFFGRDGADLLVGTTLGRLHILDARTLEPGRDPIQVAPGEWGGDERVFGHLEPGPNGLALALFTSGSFLVDYHSGTVEPLDISAFSAGWSPDGERIFITRTDGSVGLLDAGSREWISPPTAAQPFAGWQVRFSADGSMVSTAAMGRVGLWDGRNGDFIGAVSVQDASSTAFTPDNATMIIAQDWGGVTTWDLDPATWVGAACRMAGRSLSEEEWRTYLPEREFTPACGT